MTNVSKYLGFTIADEGDVRGAWATMKRPDGSFEELYFEPHDDIHAGIADWWLEHGDALNKEAGAKVDASLAALA